MATAGIWFATEYRAYVRLVGPHRDVISYRDYKGVLQAVAAEPTPHGVPAKAIEGLAPATPGRIMVRARVWGGGNKSLTLRNSRGRWHVCDPYC